MRLYERGSRTARVALLAAGCIWLMSLVPADAEDSTIQSIVQRISDEASKLSEAAHGPNPSVNDVANKAFSLSTTMAKLDPTIEKEPDEASSHVDAPVMSAYDPKRTRLTFSGGLEPPNGGIKIRLFQLNYQ